MISLEQLKLELQTIHTSNSEDSVQTKLQDNRSRKVAIFNKIPNIQHSQSLASDWSVTGQSLTSHWPVTGQSLASMGFRVHLSP